MSHPAVIGQRDQLQPPVHPPAWSGPRVAASPARQPRGITDERVPRRTAPSCRGREAHRFAGPLVTMTLEEGDTASAMLPGLCALAGQLRRLRAVAGFVPYAPPDIVGNRRLRSSLSLSLRDT